MIIIAWWKPYGDAPIKTPQGDVFMFRRYQRVRFYNEYAEQVGPEQSNVAPAIAYAMHMGWEL